MTTLSSFRINQPPGTPYAEWDRARADLVLGSVECEAYEKAQDTYRWEFASLPEGVSVTINNSTTHTCNFVLDTTGGYLVRLIANEGAPNESITTLYVGVVLEGSGLAVPALAETTQDNSRSPYTGERGTEYKDNAFRRAVDLSLWTPTKTVVTSTLSYGDSGKLLQALVDFQELTLPEPVAGAMFRVQGVGVPVSVLAPDGGDIAGPWLGVGSSRWTALGCNPDSMVFLRALKNDAGDYEWWAVGGNGSVVNINDIDESWTWGFGNVEQLRTGSSVPPGWVLGTSSVGGPSLQWVAMKGFSQILDPAASTLVLTALQDGALVMTTNSTGGKTDIHDVHLPTPSHGLVFTVQHSFGVPGEAYMTVEVDAGGQQIVLGGVYDEAAEATPWEGTKIGLYDSAVVQFFGLSATEWLCVILGGSVDLNPDAEDGTEQVNSYGPWAYSKGGGDSNSASWMERGAGNKVSAGHVGWGQDGWMFGVYGELLSANAQTYGKYAKAREDWNAAAVTGLVMDDVIGRCQSVRGMVLGAETFDGTTWVRLANPPGANPPRVEDNMFFVFRGQVVVKSLLNATAMKAWQIEGAVSVSSGVPTLESSTLIVVAETSYLNEDTWALYLDVQTDIYSAILAFDVRGESGQSLIWNATIETSEVQGYTPI